MCQKIKKSVNKFKKNYIKIKRKKGKQEKYNHFVRNKFFFAQLLNKIKSIKRQTTAATAKEKTEKQIKDEDLVLIWIVNVKCKGRRPDLYILILSF